MAGHRSVTETTAMDAQVTAVTGTAAATTGASHTSVAFVPGGETSFRLPIGDGQAIHAVTLDVSLEASLRIPIPPLTQLTHHPERVEQVTKTVHLLRPGDSDSDSETATATCDDGATSSATATAYAYVPSTTIAKEVTVDVLHKEHVRAEVVERSPITRTRAESLTLASPWGRTPPSRYWSCPSPSRKSRPPSRSPPTTSAAGSRRWAGSGPGEARDCGNPAGRGRAGDDRRGPGRGAGDAPPVRPRAHGDGLRRLRPLLFAIVWAGFILMAEGAEERGGGRAKAAVVMAVVGLVLVLSAKGIAALLSSGLVEFPSPVERRRPLMTNCKRLARTCSRSAGPATFGAGWRPCWRGCNHDSRTAPRPRSAGGESGGAAGSEARRPSCPSFSCCRTWTRTARCAWTG